MFPKAGATLVQRQNTWSEQGNTSDQIRSQGGSKDEM